MGLKLSRVADVVEYTHARGILYLCGYSARREGDNLVVYPGGEYQSSLYCKEPKKEDVLSNLYCDEGWRSECLFSDGRCGTNQPWFEMCDMNSVLRLVVARFKPGHAFESSPYMGRGRSARYMHAQYVEAIDEIAASSDEFNEKFNWPEAKNPSEFSAGDKEYSVRNV